MAATCNTVYSQDRSQNRAGIAYRPRWRPWTPEEDATLAERYVGGESAGALVAAFHRRSRSAILGRASRLGLLRRGKKPALKQPYRPGVDPRPVFAP